MKTNKQVYDMEYRRKNKKQINIDLNLDEYEELKEIIEKTGLTKVEIFRKGIQTIKESTN